MKFHVVILCTDFQVRLTGGQTHLEGNVEIGLNGQWSSVCDTRRRSTYDDANAHVVCHSLGFPGGVRHNPGTYGAAASPTRVISPR